MPTGVPTCGRISNRKSASVYQCDCWARFRLSHTCSPIRYGLVFPRDCLFIGIMNDKGRYHSLKSAEERSCGGLLDGLEGASSDVEAYPIAPWASHRSLNYAWLDPATLATPYGTIYEPRVRSEIGTVLIAPLGTRCVNNRRVKVWDVDTLRKPAKAMLQISISSQIPETQSTRCAARRQLTRFLGFGRFSCLSALVGMMHSPSGGVERDPSRGSSISSIGTGSPAQPHLSQVGRSHSTSGKSRR